LGQPAAWRDGQKVQVDGFTTRGRAVHGRQAGVAVDADRRDGRRCAPRAPRNTLCPVNARRIARAACAPGAVLSSGRHRLQPLELIHASSSLFAGHFELQLARAVALPCLARGSSSGSACQRKQARILSIASGDFFAAGVRAQKRPSKSPQPAISPQADSSSLRRIRNRLVSTRRVKIDRVLPQCAIALSIKRIFRMWRLRECTRSQDCTGTCASIRAIIR
jgi:hypothetical protein